jgi:hypothetical protein
MNWITVEGDGDMDGKSEAQVSSAQQTIINPAQGIPKEKAKQKKVANNDPVNHPDHYKVGGIETIDFIEAKSLGYNLGNVIKYVTRADHKGKKLEDLKKGAWYLAREIANLEKQ